jgi:hypothetical protein
MLLAENVLKMPDCSGLDHIGPLPGFVRRMPEESPACSYASKIKIAGHH